VTSIAGRANGALVASRTSERFAYTAAMGRRGFPILIVALMATLAASPSKSPVAADRIWFCPGPGTLDFIRLFEHPEEWQHARQIINVFKIYQGHTQTPPDPGFLPNSYEALARAGVFRTLNTWGKKIAIEAGSVKEFYCTPDAVGMNASVANTLASIEAVTAAGGTVSYIAMDEPFVSGRSRVCGGPAMEPTADRVAAYVARVTAAFPNVRVGLIEAYPFSSADALQSALELLKTRAVPPAFFHMDVDWHLSGATAFKRDVARLRAYCAAENIPFGVIITGYDGDADALYAVDVYGITELVADTFGAWGRMPDHVIFQSWSKSATGRWITPNNLPEDRVYSHTAMLVDVVRRLKGTTGPSTGRAVIRR
jgi:hypothetical protein